MITYLSLPIAPGQPWPYQELPEDDPLTTLSQPGTPRPAARPPPGLADANRSVIEEKIVLLQK
jgi:hypothetical protein